MPEMILSEKPAVQTVQKKEPANSLVFSYLTLRNMIGISGMLLPVVLGMTSSRGPADRRIEPSISDYYYSSNGDVLVVMLSVLGVFLFTYNGYKWQEKCLTTLAAVCALGIAFSPLATWHPNSLTIHIAKSAVPKIGGIECHGIFACSFFVCLAIVSLVYFPKTNQATLKTPDGKRTPKAKRNIVYKICGYTMLLCVALTAVYLVVRSHMSQYKNVPFIFIFETVAIEAFGISWITKGETLWPDGEHYLSRAFRRAKAIKFPLN